MIGSTSAAPAKPSAAPTASRGNTLAPVVPERASNWAYRACPTTGTNAVATLIGSSTDAAKAVPNLATPGRNPSGPRWMMSLRRTSSCLRSIRILSASSLIPSSGISNLRFRSLTLDRAVGASSLGLAATGCTPNIASSGVMSSGARSGCIAAPNSPALVIDSNGERINASRPTCPRVSPRPAEYSSRVVLRRVGRPSVKIAIREPQSSCRVGFLECPCFATAAKCKESAGQMHSARASVSRR